jgi:hypothetical protein
MNYLFILNPEPPPEKGSSSGPFHPPLSFSVSGIFPPIRNNPFDHHLASRKTKTKIESSHSAFKSYFRKFQTPGLGEVQYYKPL